ncbi:MAG: zinc ribbon domain-containing protein [Planctomycetota bacterium]|nr:MAG: zinc ribbon domain-containing protein [Planctomycetota bacterium]
MPTYEYRCKECGHEFEVFQAITAEPIQECEKCKGEVHRLISAGSGLHFKGEGFYTTDYRKSPSPQKEQEKSESSGETKKGDNPS